MQSASPIERQPHRTPRLTGLAPHPRWRFWISRSRNQRNARRIGCRPPPLDFGFHHMDSRPQEVDRRLVPVDYERSAQPVGSFQSASSKLLAVLIPENLKDGLEFGVRRLEASIASWSSHRCSVRAGVHRKFVQISLLRKPGTDGAISYGGGGPGKIPRFRRSTHRPKRPPGRPYDPARPGVVIN